MRVCVLVFVRASHRQGGRTGRGAGRKGGEDKEGEVIRKGKVMS